MKLLKNIIAIILIAITTSTTLVFSQSPSSPYQAIRLNDGNPIITPSMFVGDPTEGENINGPSMIRIPDWIDPADRADPSAQYYLYFAHHDGEYIRMAWAADIEGPYTLYNDLGSRGGRGVLDNHGPDNNNPTDGDILLTNDVVIGFNHLASPDVIIDDVNQRIILYFHSGPSFFVNGVQDNSQVTWVSTSDFGLDFYANIGPTHLGASYFRIFEHNNLLHALDNGGRINRAISSTDPWAAPPGHDFLDRLWERPTDHLFNDAIEEPSSQLRVRHTGVKMEGNQLQVFYSRRGEFQERIQLSFVDVTPPNLADWVVTPANASGFLDPIEILTPNPGWEGGERLLDNSEASAGVDVNQLRDPDIFEDSDGQIYMIYAGNGEGGLGIARLDETPTPNLSLTATEDAHTREGSDSNFGTLDNLRISAGPDPSDNRILYMKFDLTLSLIHI